MFDECLGKPLLEDVKKLLNWDTPPPTIHHLLDYFRMGTPDAIWIPQMKREGWIILTADRAKKSNKMMLPKICLEYKITHILMGSSILHLKQNQKANTIVALWEDIKKCKSAPQGSRFMMQLTQKGNPVLKRLI